MKTALRQQQKLLDGIRHTGMSKYMKRWAGIHCLERYLARNFLFADRWILASAIAPALPYYMPSMAIFARMTS